MRLVIADGHVLFGEGLRSLLQAEPGFEIVGQARTVAETIEQVTALRPDVVLLSVNLADGNAFDALRAIVGRAPECAVVVLTWKGKRADHVAFLDKQGDEWKLLGGNQTPTSGKGGAVAVSLRPFNPKTAIAYIWPA